MDSSDTDVTPMLLSSTYFRSADGNNNSTSRNISARTRRSASMPIRVDEPNMPSRDALIQMSGPLRSNSNNNELVENPTQVHNDTTADAISKPNNIEKDVHQQWNTFLASCCVLAVFLDPMFYFLLSVKPDNKCIMLNWTVATIILTVLRSVTDLVFLLQMLLQFRHAYGTMHKFFCYFIIDFFLVLPLPQIIIIVTLSDSMSVEAANDLLLFLFLQYVPRMLKFLPFLNQTPLGYLVTNLLGYAFLSHTIGSIWYLNGLQRVNDCFTDACRHSNITNYCKKFNCGLGGDDFKADNSSWLLWKNNENATACIFGQGRFDFGIFQKTVNLTTHGNFMTRYYYSLFWGFQQLSTLAGNQVPSYVWVEVLFTMMIVGNGLFLYVGLIANVQNFLQARQRRELELYLKMRELEKWMGDRRLLEERRRQVREAELFNWAATGGVKEKMLMENLPEDLQRDIRRDIFLFVTNVLIRQGLDEPVIDAILERLQTKTYIKGSKILCPNRPIDKMVFIIYGIMESIGEDGVAVRLGGGDVCGEELLTWCLQHSSANEEDPDGNIQGRRSRLLSKRSVRCLTNVKASVLRAADLEEVCSDLFSA